MRKQKIVRRKVLRTARITSKIPKVKRVRISLTGHKSHRGLTTIGTKSKLSKRRNISILWSSIPKLQSIFQDPRLRISSDISKN